MGLNDIPIRDLEVSDDLKVSWDDRHTADYSWFWLRDNARDPVSFDSRSNQRELFTAALPDDIRPVSVSLCENRQALTITWQDLDTPVSYAGAFLREYSAPAVRPTTLELWKSSPDVRSMTLASLEQAAPVMGASLADALGRQGFALVTDCPTEPSSVERIAGLLGYVRETIFGGVWQFEADEAMADSAYTPKELRPHTDGTYSLDAPGVQILLCLENQAQGGESILVDGFQVAEQLRSAGTEVFDDLTRIEIEGCYQGDGVTLRARRPVIRMAGDCLEQISFNNYDRAPMVLPKADMQRMYRAITAIDRQFNDPVNQWRYALKAGEALVFDNWRVLHGRSAYTGQRRMAGAYVNREDVLSFLSSAQGPVPGTEQANPLEKEVS